MPEKEINIFEDTKVTENIVAIISQHEGRIFGILIRYSNFKKYLKIF